MPHKIQKYTVVIGLKTAQHTEALSKPIAAKSN